MQPCGDELEHHAEEWGLLTAEQEKPTQAARARNLQVHEEAVQLQVIHVHR